MDTGSKTYQLNRGRISLAVSGFTVPLLSGIYRSFDGDMVAALILGEIAHRNVEAWLAEESNTEDPLRDGQQRLSLMRPCNALSIADACGLPRETVRRKVNLLIEKAYVQRNEAGHLYISETIEAQFQGTTDQLVEGLLATARRIEALLAEQRAPLDRLRLPR